MTRYRINNFQSNIGLAFAEILGKDFYISFQIFTNWENLVPAKIAEKTKPIYFNKGKLHILTNTAQWANELHLNAPMLIEKINQNLGDGLVESLDLRQGNISVFSKEVEREFKVKEYKLTPEEEETISKLIEKYDPDFRSLARKMYKFYYIQRKKES